VLGFSAHILVQQDLLHFITTLLKLNFFLGTTVEMQCVSRLPKILYSGIA